VLTAIGLAANLTNGSGFFLDVDDTEFEVLRAILDGVLKHSPGVSEHFFRVNRAECIEIDRPFGNEDYFTFEEFISPLRGTNFLCLVSRMKSPFAGVYAMSLVFLAEINSIAAFPTTRLVTSGFNSVI